MAGISGLLIGGSEYDVKFSNKSFNENFGTGNLDLPQTLVIDAGNAIASAINATGVYRLAAAEIGYWIFLPFHADSTRSVFLNSGKATA